MGLEQHEVQQVTDNKVQFAPVEFGCKYAAVTCHHQLNHGPRVWGSLDAEKAPEVTVDGCKGEAQGHEGTYHAGLSQSFCSILHLQCATESKISDTSGYNSTLSCFQNTHN